MILRIIKVTLSDWRDYSFDVFSPYMASHSFYVTENHWTWLTLVLKLIKNKAVKIQFKIEKCKVFKDKNNGESEVEDHEGRVFRLPNEEKWEEEWVFWRVLPWYEFCAVHIYQTKYTIRYAQKDGVTSVRLW